MSNGVSGNRARNEVIISRTYSLMVETFRKSDGTYEHKVMQTGADSPITVLASEADIMSYETIHQQEIEAERARGNDVSTARLTITSKRFLG